MRKVGRYWAIVATALLVVRCGGIGGPSGLGYDDTGTLSSGYTGNGFASFGQVLDPQFLYLYFNSSLPEGNWDCVTDGHCGLGGLTDSMGTFSAKPDSFLFVSTANFVDENSEEIPQSDVVVVTSGVVTKDLTVTNSTQFDSLRVSFEWAFLTSRLSPAVHNDSIVVRVKSDGDSTTIFKVTSADLQSGAVPQQPGGCGQHAIIPDRPITYSHCTGWATAMLDVTPYRDRTFVLQFIASEGGQSLDDTVDEPSAFLFRKLKVEGGK